MTDRGRSPIAQAAPLRLATLISGGGRTAVNLLDRIEDGSLAAQLVVAIASRPECAGVERLRARGVRVEVVSRTDQGDPSNVHDHTDAILLDADIDLICLCGWLRHFRVRGPRADWTGRVINIHPSLLPRFGGKGMHGTHVHAAVLASGERVSGCTVHEVDELYDHGPTMLQTEVPVLVDDDVATLAARVFEAECRTYPEAIRIWSARRTSA